MSYLGLEVMPLRPGDKIMLPSGRAAVVSELSRHVVEFLYLDSVASRHFERVRLSRRFVRQMCLGRKM